MERPRISTGNFILMMELRKKIIIFRDVVDLPPREGSVSVNELVIGTMKDLHRFYPEIITRIQLTEVKRQSLNKVLFYFCEALKTIGDSWMMNSEWMDKATLNMYTNNEHHNSERIVEMALATLDCMIKIPKETFDSMDEDDEDDCDEIIDSPPTGALDQRTAGSNSGSPTSCSASPVTPTSVLPEYPGSPCLEPFSGSSPLLRSLRAQALGKLNPVDLKRLSFCTQSDVGSRSGVRASQQNAETREVMEMKYESVHHKNFSGDELMFEMIVEANAVPEMKEEENPENGRSSAAPLPPSSPPPSSLWARRNDASGHRAVPPPPPPVLVVSVAPVTKSETEQSILQENVTANETKLLMPPKTPEPSPAPPPPATLMQLVISTIPLPPPPPQMSMSSIGAPPPPPPPLLMSSKGRNVILPLSFGPPPAPAPMISSHAATGTRPPFPPPPPMISSKGTTPPPPSIPLGNGAALPPPPPSAARSLRPKKAQTKLKRSTQIGNLYRTLKGKVEGVNQNSKSNNGRKGSGGSSAGGQQGMADALAEMTKRSAYFQQIEEDVRKHTKSILELKNSISTFQTKDMTKLIKFHAQVESILENLADETQVLARFEGFPQKKLEAIRMAAALYSKLNGVVVELHNWKVEAPLGQLLERTERYFSKIKGEMELLERIKDEETKKFEAHNIHFDFHILVQIKEAIVDVSSNCMELALKERRDAEGRRERGEKWERKKACVKMLWRAFQFAFRVYSFAGGHDDRADKLTRELAHEIQTDPQHHP